MLADNERQASALALGTLSFITRTLRGRVKNKREQLAKSCIGSALL
jgi:hypothetical protein